MIEAGAFHGLESHHLTVAGSADGPHWAQDPPLALRILQFPRDRTQAGPPSRTAAPRGCKNERLTDAQILLTARTLAQVGDQAMEERQERGLERQRAPVGGERKRQHSRP